ncbi:hypothetical protein Zmor_021452 [Zophobas morio]|uniref:Uncharacterized protein n=1 Tax=Zophobas morio TaxID=2755281 RepID=A0AA38I5R8_9CUCU|nr:hypothetical protein Zmor_021452 [Zophobas morio]
MKTAVFLLFVSVLIVAATAFPTFDQLAHPSSERFRRAVPQPKPDLEGSESVYVAYPYYYPYYWGHIIGK